MGTKSEPNREQVAILRYCLEEKPLAEIMSALKKVNRSKFRTVEILPLLEHSWLERTIPDKPTSSKQKYRTTLKARDCALLMKRRTDVRKNVLQRLFAKAYISFYGR